MQYVAVMSMVACETQEYRSKIDFNQVGFKPKMLFLYILIILSCFSC